MAKRKPSSKRGQVRLGFTYGYQWGAFGGEPPVGLRLPMEALTTKGSRVRVYPIDIVKDGEKGMPSGLRFLMEHLDSGARSARGGARWTYEAGLSLIEDRAPIHVACDWHQEHSYSPLTPFKGGTKNDYYYITDPVEWMSAFVRSWDYQVNNAKVGKWPELYWLDQKVESWKDWERILAAHGGEVDTFEVRSLDEWGNARDGYETNDESHLGEITLPRGSDHDAMVAALREMGWLAANVLGPGENWTGEGEAPPRVDIEDGSDTDFDIIGPEVPVERQPFDAGAFTLSYIEVPFAEELWNWAWDETIERNFGEGGIEEAEPATPQDVQQHFRKRWPPKVLKSDIMPVVNAAVLMAVAAHRDSDSRIPLLRLYLLESVVEGDEYTEENERIAPTVPDTDGGDITTEDHRHWYQYGKLYFSGDEAGLQAQMDRDNFFPAVWLIDDHGGATLIERDHDERDHDTTTVAD